MNLLRQLGVAGVEGFEFVRNLSRRHIPFDILSKLLGCSSILFVTVVSFELDHFQHVPFHFFAMLGVKLERDKY